MKFVLHVYLWIFFLPFSIYLNEEVYLKLCLSLIHFFFFIVLMPSNPIRKRKKKKKANRKSYLEFECTQIIVDNSLINSYTII